MEPIEDELRRVYARRMPPPDFTVRLMQHVRREASFGKSRKVFPWQWVAVGAAAATLIMGVYVGTRQEQKQIAVETEQVSLEGQQAETQLLLTLHLAGSKINKARDAVVRPAQKESQ